METQALSDDCLCSVDRRDDVILIDVQSAIHGRHIDAVEAITESMGRDTGDAYGVLVRVAHGAALPTLETRARCVKYLWAHHANVKSIHVALEGHGFWAATGAALAATIARAVPHGPQIHVHACLDRAATELAAHLHRNADAVADGMQLARALRRTS